MYIKKEDAMNAINLLYAEADAKRVNLNAAITIREHKHKVDGSTHRQISASSPVRIWLVGSCDAT